MASFSFSDQFFSKKICASLTHSAPKTLAKLIFQPQKNHHTSFCCPPQKAISDPWHRDRFSAVSCELQRRNRSSEGKNTAKPLRTRFCRFVASGQTDRFARNAAETAESNTSCDKSGIRSAPENHAPTIHHQNHKEHRKTQTGRFRRKS